MGLALGYEEVVVSSQIKGEREKERENCKPEIIDLYISNPFKNNHRQTMGQMNYVLKLPRQPNC